MDDTDLNDRMDSVLESARELEKIKPNWMDFYKEVLWRDGVARREFADADEWALWEASDQLRVVRMLMDGLRECKSLKSEETSTITIRLPKLLHQKLKVEAHNRKISMNGLVVLLAAECCLRVEEEDESGR